MCAIGDDAIALPGKGGHKGRVPGDGKRPAHRHALLLVEDDFASREPLVLLFEHLGMDVVDALNGREALDRLRSGFRPCLVLLDLAMPDMNGVEFRRAQLADPALAAIPVAVLSAGGWVAEAEARQVGLRVFLPKPLDVDRLVQLLKTHCAAEPS